MTVTFEQDVMIAENVISDEVCDNLIKYLEASCELGCAGNELSFENDPRRQDTQFYARAEEVLTGEQYTYFRSGMSGDELNRSLWDNALGPYIEKYSILKNIPLCSLDIKLQRTQPGGGFHSWHYETGSYVSTRVLTWSIFLNDDFEAGETEFLYRQLRVEPKKGSCVVFPTDFISTHRGNPPIGGTKYIATGWVTNANPFGWDAQMQSCNSVTMI